MTSLCLSLSLSGEVSGLLGQENDFSIWPSYVLCLGFTFALKRQGPIYWPGSTFGMVSLSIAPPPLLFDPLPAMLR